MGTWTLIVFRQTRRTVMLISLGPGQAQAPSVTTPKWFGPNQAGLGAGRETDTLSATTWVETCLDPPCTSGVLPARPALKERPARMVFAGRLLRTGGQDTRRDSCAN